MMSIMANRAGSLLKGSEMEAFAPELLAREPCNEVNHVERPTPCVSAAASAGSGHRTGERGAEAARRGAQKGRCEAS